MPSEQDRVPRRLRVTRRNAAFQQWSALLTNRKKRNRLGEMVVQGVRPISLAVSHGYDVRTLLVDPRERHSEWAQRLIEAHRGDVLEVAPELMAELGERAEGTPELVAIVGVPADDLSRIPQVDNPLVVVFDRPSSPGNIGTLVRSADALGGTALVVTGHAADPWDPQAIRASTGSVFSLPVLRAPTVEPLLQWARDCGASVIGTDEDGEHELAQSALVGPTLLVVGNETTGMSAAWAHACDQVVRIPIGGGASSLNAAVAGSVVLYEAARQRATR